jgi:hypothetical protein
MHRATTQRELPESANRSIAREGHSKPLHSASNSSRHVSLDKQCLLIEVRFEMTPPRSVIVAETATVSYRLRCPKGAPVEQCCL